MKTELPIYFLKPGELISLKEPSKIKTLLGTCVAVCLFDKNLKIGGMNHFMLHEGSPDPTLRGKYATNAIPLLISDMLRLGSQRVSLQAKIFGGADNTTGFSTTSQIGMRNVEYAIQMLAEEKIPIVAQNTGGSLGRKIFFYTNTGSVYMKFLSSNPIISI